MITIKKSRVIIGIILMLVVGVLLLGVGILTGWLLHTTDLPDVILPAPKLSHSRAEDCLIHYADQSELDKLSALANAAEKKAGSYAAQHQDEPGFNKDLTSVQTLYTLERYDLLFSAHLISTAKRMTNSDVKRATLSLADQIAEESGYFLHAQGFNPTTGEIEYHDDYPESLINFILDYHNLAAKRFHSVCK